MRTTSAVEVRACGIVAPVASTAGELFDLVSSAPTPPESCRTAVSHELLEMAAGLPTRESRKVDRFSLLALGAARRALGAGGLDDREKATCGVVTGNTFAGWTFTEPQLRVLHQVGVDGVSPYLATAWFPAAPQGQVTIHLGLTGYAKTVTTDRCAGAQAIGLAYERIRTGRTGMLLAGGVEAPVTPLVRRAFPSPEVRNLLCEGAAYLLLAGAQGDSPDRIQIAGHWSWALPPQARPEDWLPARLESLRERDTCPRDPSWLILNGAGEEEIPGALAALATVWPLQRLRLLVPARQIGECLAASGALAAVVAAEALARGPEEGMAVVVSWGHQCCDILCLKRNRRKLEMS
jgi:hypothetical protein